MNIRSVNQCAVVVSRAIDDACVVPVLFDVVGVDGVENEEAGLNYICALYSMARSRRRIAAAVSEHVKEESQCQK